MIEIKDQSTPPTPLLPHQQTQPQPSLTRTGRLHLPFLDGLRGLAAFYVLLFHVVADGQQELEAGSFLLNVLRFGHEAVVVFIVLSGFVLTLPVIRSPRLSLKGGCCAFFKRRARRILPAYYAALFLFPLYVVGVEGLKHLTGEGANWSRLSEMFFSIDMLSHLFLLHNLSPDWFLSFNPVLWSLSTEWWIYFIFALILLPVWQRFGLGQAVALSLGLGLLPTALHLASWPTMVGYPHLLGAFGLGMVSAALLFEACHTPCLAVWRTGLLTVAALAFIAFGGLALLAPATRFRPETIWLLDLLIAVACAATILLIASANLHAGPAPRLARLVTRLLESRPLVSLGQFSYSLYLTHLVLWAMLGITLNLTPVKQALGLSLQPMPIRLLVSIPVLLAGAYGFHLLFEKPFLNTRR